MTAIAVIVRKGSAGHPRVMSSTPRRSATDRDRAIARLRTITIGTSLAGVAAVGAFGAIAAASYDGTTNDVTTAVLDTDSGTTAAATTTDSTSATSTATDESASVQATAAPTAAATTTTSTTHATTGSS